MPMATEVTKNTRTSNSDQVCLWKTADIKSSERPSAREGHCSCVIGNDVYIFGGVSITSDDSFEEKDDLWKFDTETKSWTRIISNGSEKPMSRSAATICAVGNKLYLFGGISQAVGWLDDFFVFDTNTNTWCEVEDSTGKLPSARDKLSSAVIGKCIWFFGGFGPQQRGVLDLEDEDDDEEDDDDEIQQLQSTQEAANFGWFDDLFMYDTETKVWSQPLQLSMGKPSPRCASSMIAYQNKLVIFGGRDAEGRTNDLHVFDTVSKKWLKELSPTGTPPTPRSFHASALTAGHYMVVIAGRGVDNQHYGDIHVLDLENMSWSELTSTKIPARGCHSLNAVGQLSESLVVFGGSSEFLDALQHCDKFHGDLLLTTFTGLSNGADGCSPTKIQKMT